MTVSTIANPAADIKRIQENQNRPASTQRGELLRDSNSGAATLPTDNIDTSTAVRSEGLDPTAARIATEAQNREAALSELSEADLDALENDAPPAPERIQAQTAAALRAQTNKLPGNVLQLLNE